jgi:hypothetical protein
LSRAEHQRIERIRLADLFERSEFPRDPFDTLTRRVKRGAGGFFRLLFLALRKVAFNKAYRIGQTVRALPTLESLHQNEPEIVMLFCSVLASADSINSNSDADPMAC